MTLPLIILFCLRAEVISLGCINSATGISIEYPANRSDIIALEMTLLKPGAGTNAMAVLETTNRLIQLSEIPSSVPDGRTILALRWICQGGLRSEYRMATMDLYRGVPDAPICKPTFVSIPNERGAVESEAVGESRRKSANDIRPPFLTNDTPVRRWHGAMINPELAEAIREHFRKPADPLPPLPPSTNTMESAFERAQIPVREIQQRAREEMLQFYRNGGQKGRGKQ